MQITLDTKYEVGDKVLTYANEEVVTIIEIVLNSDGTADYRFDYDDDGMTARQNTVYVDDKYKRATRTAKEAANSLTREQLVKIAHDVAAIALNFSE